MTPRAIESGTSTGRRGVRDFLIVATVVACIVALSPATSAQSSVSVKEGSAADEAPDAANQWVTDRKGLGSEPTPLTARDRTSSYPRGVRLQHNGDANGRIIASVTTSTPRGWGAIVFESVDDGRSFQEIAQLPVSERNGQAGMCCGTLFELPKQIGDLPEGTLLYAASVGAQAEDRRMDLDIWNSQDAGRTWAYLSVCASATDTGGLWEPEFAVDANGRLVCHYTAEEPRDPERNGPPPQRLVRTVSTDGVNWSAPTETVRPAGDAIRPGMPVVRALPDGTHFMVFELCGPTMGVDRCAIRFRTSTDGWDWGDPDDHGKIITSANGRYFAHAATVAWAADGTPQGGLLVIGQLLRDADGSLAEGNGKTVFVNRHRNGPWREISAPVEVDAIRHFCPNYSSSLVPLAGGREFLQLAPDLTDGALPCRSSFATGRIL